MSFVNNGTHGYNLVASATTFSRETAVLTADPPGGYTSREIAILGSMITSKFPRAGDRIEYRLEGFPPVVLQA